MTGVVMADAASPACSPAAAVPVSAKIPVPMIAPMPSAVRSNAVSERFITRSGASDSRISISGLLVLNSEAIGDFRLQAGGHTGFYAAHRLTDTRRPVNVFPPGPGIRRTRALVRPRCACWTRCMGRQWLHAKREVANLQERPGHRQTRQGNHRRRENGRRRSRRQRPPLRRRRKGPRQASPATSSSARSRRAPASAARSSSSSTSSSKATRRTRCRSSSKSSPTTTTAPRPISASSSNGPARRAGQQQVPLRPRRPRRGPTPTRASTSKQPPSKPARNEVEPLSHDENDDIPADGTGARFVTEPTDHHAVSQWLSSNGWTVVTSEIGYVAKNFPELTETHARSRRVPAEPRR